MMSKSNPRALLEELLAHLTRRTKKVEADRHRAGEPLEADFGEQAVQRENDEVLDSLEREGVAQIELVRAALARLDDGTYGTCADCGAEIPTVRLQALPYAITCVACAERREQSEAEGE